jgi:hypothetical protein
MIHSHTNSTPEDIEADLRSVVYNTAVEHGGVDAYNFFLER